MSKLTNLEKAIRSDLDISVYLENVSNTQFHIDVLELMKAYSDKEAIKNAIHLLNDFIKTT